MILNLVSIILVLVGYINLSYGFECPNIRLDKNFKDNKPVNQAKFLSMKALPVQEQKLGICYAYTATQMIDAYQQLKTKVTPNPNSPIFTAVNTSANWSTDGVEEEENGKYLFPFEGSFVCSAFDRAKQTGVCPKSEIENFLKKKGYTEKEFFEALYKVEQKYKAKITDINIDHSRELNHLWQSSLQSDSINEMSKVWKKNVSYKISEHYLTDVKVCELDQKNELYNDLVEIFGSTFLPTKEIFAQYYDLDLFNEHQDLAIVFNWICPVSKRIAIPDDLFCKEFDQLEAFKESNNEIAYIKKIIEVLKVDSMPVGINYCSKMFKYGKYYSGIAKRNYNSVTFKKDDQNNSMCGRHASIIIGSRFNQSNKTCEFLIRNTWGTNCNYHKDFECEEGQIWVDHKTLSKNIYQVNYLSN